MGTNKRQVESRGDVLINFITSPLAQKCLSPCLRCAIFVEYFDSSLLCSYHFFSSSVCFFAPQWSIRSNNSTPPRSRPPLKNNRRRPPSTTNEWSTSARPARMPQRASSWGWAMVWTLSTPMFWRASPTESSQYSARRWARAATPASPRPSASGVTRT